MIELSEIRRLLADRNLQRVADASGVSYGRLYRLMHVPEGKPSHDTVTKIVAYLEEKQLQKVA